MGHEFTIVGHRGLPQDYPENTLKGVKAALDGGVSAVEIDIQLSADGVPILLHDDCLLRVSGAPGSIINHTFKALEKISVHEPDRFGEKYNPAPIISLKAFSEQLSSEEAEFFIEIFQA